MMTDTFDFQEALSYIKAGMAVSLTILGIKRVYNLDHNGFLLFLPQEGPPVEGPAAPGHAPGLLDHQPQSAAGHAVPGPQALGAAADIEPPLPADRPQGRGLGGEVLPLFEDRLDEGPHAPLSAGLPVREHCVLSIPGQDALQPGPHPRTPAKAKLSSAQ